MDTKNGQKSGPNQFIADNLAAYSRSYTIKNEAGGQDLNGLANVWCVGGGKWSWP